MPKTTVIKDVIICRMLQHSTLTIEEREKESWKDLTDSPTKMNALGLLIHAIKGTICNQGHSTPKYLASKLIFNLI